MLLGSEGEKAFCRNTQSPRDRGGRGQQKTLSASRPLARQVDREPPQESWPRGSKTWQPRNTLKWRFWGKTRPLPLLLQGMGAAL